MTRGLIAIAAGIAVLAGLGTGIGEGLVAAHAVSAIGRNHEAESKDPYYYDLRYRLNRNSSPLWFTYFFHLIIRIQIKNSLRRKKTMPDIAAKLFPNPTTMIVQLCSTAIMLLLFKKYLWNYVLEFFQKRADFIEGNINDAKAKNEKASEYLLESEKQAKEAAKQYKEIIDRG